MLQPAENVRLAYAAAPGGPGWSVLHVEEEKFRLGPIDRTAFQALIAASGRAPQKIGVVNDYACWMFRDHYYWDNDDLSEDEACQLFGALPAA